MSRKYQFNRTSLLHAYVQSKPGKGSKYNNDCEDHLTYIEKYVFYYYEVQLDSGIHIPNLVILDDFKGNKFIFSNDDKVSNYDKFCRWALTWKEKI